MSDFPVLSLRGSTDAERLAELASYIPSLTSAIEREMMSLDFSNLNEGLQQRINNSITEHQDLSGFASKNYAKNHFYEKKEVDGIKEELEDNIEDVENQLSQYAKSSELSALSQQISNLTTTVNKLNSYVFDTGRWLNVTLQYELREIKDSLKALEDEIK